MMAPSLERQKEVESEYIAQVMQVAGMTGPVCLCFAQRFLDVCERGRREYGDASFDIGPEELVEETISEAVDVPGWLHLLYAIADEYSLSASARSELIAIGAEGAKLFLRLIALRELVKPQKGMLGNPITGDEWNDYQGRR
jgi:hypothetical protein